MSGCNGSRSNSISAGTCCDSGGRCAKRAVTPGSCRAAGRRGRGLHGLAADGLRRSRGRRGSQRPGRGRLSGPRRSSGARPRASRPGRRGGDLGAGLRRRRRATVPLFVPGQPAAVAHPGGPGRAGPAGPAGVLLLHPGPRHGRPHRAAGGRTRRVRLDRRRRRRARLRRLLPALPTGHRAALAHSAGTAAHPHPGTSTRGGRVGPGLCGGVAGADGGAGRPRDRRCGGQRRGARGDRHRRSDRHVRPTGRPVADAEHLPAVPRARRRHRRLERPDRRDGRDDLSAGRRGNSLWGRDINGR